MLVVPPGAPPPLKRLMLVGGARSWKYDFLNAFADFPKHEWVKFSRGIGRDEGYYYEHYNAELFESAHNCYAMRCMENACYTLHELGQELPDGLVLILNGMEAPEDEVLATLRMARRAGIDRLCVFLDWYEEMLLDPGFALLEEEQVRQVRGILGEMGFGGAIPFTSGDSSRLLSPPDMQKRPDGNGVDPKAIYAGRVRSGANSSLSRWGAAVLNMLDAQWPERPETPCTHLRLTQLAQTSSPKKLTARFEVAGGTVRTGAQYFLVAPQRAPMPVSIGKLFCGGRPDETQETTCAFYDGRYGPTPYTARLALPEAWEGTLPLAAWLAVQPGALRETDHLCALMAYPGHEAMRPGDGPREDEDTPVLVDAEGEHIAGTARFSPAAFLPAGVREVHIALARPVCLPPQARIALQATGSAGQLWPGSWWQGVLAEA